MVSAAVTLAGCVSTGGIAPQARAIDVATLTQDHEPAVAVADTWWTAFGDARLDELVDRGLASNPSLATVRLCIERANALADAAEAARLPRVDAGLDITRERYSAQGAYPPVLAGSIRNSGSLFLSGSWELDAFGRQRSALEAEIGSKRAAEADYQEARVVLASNIVRQYVQLARLVDQREVLARSLAQREEILGLAQKRVAGGLDTAVELRHGEGAVPEIRAAIEASDEQRELLRHVLSALTGQGPQALDGWTPRLAKVALVEPDDRRSVSLALTPSGVELADKGISLVRHYDRTLMHGVDERQAGQLQLVLQRLLENANRLGSRDGIARPIDSTSPRA